MEDTDDDNDGLLDIEEDKNQNGRLDDGETDPLNSDTDGDGISDRLDEYPRLPYPPPPEKKKGISFFGWIAIISVLVIALGWFVIWFEPFNKRGSD